MKKDKTKNKDNKINNYATLEDVKLVKETLKEIKSENSSNSDFNLGIFYGLLFSIMGNLFITLLFDYKLKNLSDDVKFLILLIFIIIVLFFLCIMIKEDKKFKSNKKRIENNLSNLDFIGDGIKKGEMISKWDLLDDRNVVQRVWDENKLKNINFHLLV